MPEGPGLTSMHMLPASLCLPQLLALMCILSLVQAPYPEPISKCSHILRYWELYEFEGNQIQAATSG